jgi:hypothetical protein
MGLYYLSTVAYAWMICLSFPCSKTGSVLWRPLRFSHKNDVRFVFTSSCLLECLCLIYVICVRLYLQLFVRVLMSYLRYLCFFAHSGSQHILCCVFYFVFCLPFLLCVPNAASFSGFFILDCPFGFL